MTTEGIDPGLDDEIARLLRPEVRLPEPIRLAALEPIPRMLELS